MDYSHIVGHEKIINSLKNAIKNDSVGHSYMFEGPKSIGKSKIAKVFAKTLLCKEEGVEPCNKCSSCLKFDSGNHPDLYIENTDGQSFKKDQIEELQKSIKTLPYEGRKKIFILENIDKITKQAQNSFLKTLEEPPMYVTILMTVTNSYSLLPTIVSRCQIFKLTPVESDKIKDVLINKLNKTPDESKIITSFSNGIIGKAIKLAESEEFNTRREEIISVIDNTLNGQKFNIFTLSDFFQKQKGNIEEILDMMMVWFRDVLFMKTLDENEFIINKDKLDVLSEQSFKITENKIYEITDAIRQTKENISSNVNYDLAIEVMLLKIQEV